MHACGESDARAGMSGVCVGGGVHFVILPTTSGCYPPSLSSHSRIRSCSTLSIRLTVRVSSRAVCSALASLLLFVIGRLSLFLCPAILLQSLHFTPSASTRFLSPIVHHEWDSRLEAERSYSYSATSDLHLAAPNQPFLDQSPLRPLPLRHSIVRQPLLHPSSAAARVVPAVPCGLLPFALPRLHSVSVGLSHSPSAAPFVHEPQQASHWKGQPRRSSVQQRGAQAADTEQ